MDMNGCIFNIQRYSLHDGPGIRTVVFMKGCPLRCVWCANPEGQVEHPELMFDRRICIKCGRCAQACPNGATTLLNGEVVIDREICKGEGECVKVCPAARQVIGKYVSVAHVLDEVRKDEVFYRNSRGGVTISGGEPMTQAGFVRELLKMCRQAGLHTAIETAGYGRWEKLREIAEFADLILYDIKHMNARLHKRYTGVSNSLILRNAEKISNEKKLIIRIPVVPGFNDSIEEMDEIANFVKELRYVNFVELLPYHRLGIHKYEKLGRRNGMGTLTFINDQMERLKVVIKSKGLRTNVYNK